MFHPMADNIDLADTLEGDIWQFLDDEAPGLVRSYYAYFDGRRFNALAGGGDAPERQDHFDSTDLVAVSTLSVEIPGSAAIEILEVRARMLSALLRRIPNDVSIDEVDRSVLSEGSPAWDLWKEVRSIRGMGPVLTDKLLARKRPHLLPVYDSVVKAALQPHIDRFWIPLWNEFRSSDRSLSAALADIRTEAGLPAHEVSLLRVLDVAIWMRNRPKSPAPLLFRPRRDSPADPGLEIPSS